MSEKSALVEYMQNLKNMADYLARGYILQSLDEEHVIEIVNNDITERRGAFSIQEYSLFDELDTTFMGEQRSIRTLVELLSEGEYKRQIEGKVDFNQPYTPEPNNAEFYNRIMKRVNTILKSMALMLIFKNRIPLSDYEFCELKRLYLDEEELDLYEEEKSGCLIYSAQKQCFCMINLKGEIIVEDIDTNIAMYAYCDFLIRQEQDALQKKAIEGIQTKRENGELSSEERE